VSSLKHYSDPDLDATAEIRQHVASQGVIFFVWAIVGHRKDLDSGEWQLDMAWLGLEDAENSWEVFSAVLVLEYMQANGISALEPLLRTKF
jgi:hypothetical protein